MRPSPLRRYAAEILSILRAAGAKWISDRCDRLGAALAYYAMFSLFPLLLLSTTAVGYALGSDATLRTRLSDSIAGIVASTEVRSLLDDTLTNMQLHRTARGIGAVVGAISLLFSASGVFSELSDSINALWRVKTPDAPTLGGKIARLVRERALAFSVVAVAGLVVLASLAVGTAVAAMKASSESSAALSWLWGPAEFVGSTLLLTGVLAAMYRQLPRARVAWADVLGGAFLAALALSILRRIFAFYLAHIGSYAAYGVVGGVLGLMLLVYLSSLIVFFGVEFARVYADRRGDGPGRAPGEAPVQGAA
jgi:membrane protein